jgi:valyl-tRNA synthetase
VQNYYGVRCDPSLPYDPDFVPPHPATPDPKDQVPISRRTSSSCATSSPSRTRGLRGAVAPDGPVGRLVDQTYRPSTTTPAHQPAGVPAQPRPRRGLPVRGAHAVGRHLPDGRRPGRARGPRLPRRLPPGRLPRRRRAPRLHRDHPPRAHPGVRRAHRPPRRRALPAAVRHDRHHAALRRRGAGAGAPGRRAREGRRHRDVLHLRRPHRRHLVARAAAADPLRSSAGTAACRPRRPSGSRTGRARRSTSAHRRPPRPHRQGARSSTALRTPATSTASPADHRKAKFYEKGEKPLEIVTTRQWYIRNGGRDADLRRAHGAGARSPGTRRTCGPLRELGRGPQRRLAHQPAALLRRADPGLVPARRARRARLRPPARARRGDLPVDPRRPARRATPRTQRGIPGGFVGDPDVMDTWATSSLTPQIAAGWERGPRPVFAGLPDGPAPAGARHHPHLAVRDRRARPPRARTACRGRTRRSAASSSTPTARR